MHDATATTKGPQHSRDPLRSFRDRSGAFQVNLVGRARPCFFLASFTMTRCSSGNSGRVRAIPPFLCPPILSSRAAVASAVIPRSRFIGHTCIHFNLGGLVQLSLIGRHVRICLQCHDRVSHCPPTNVRAALWKQCPSVSCKRRHQGFGEKWRSWSPSRAEFSTSEHSD